MDTLNQNIVAATQNKGKIAELNAMFASLSNVTLLSLSDFSDIVDVEETGQTFEENAVLKAKGYALQTGTFCLADDSGLSVAALDGRPGVLSARYGGEATPFDQKMSKLLTEMQRSPNKGRQAAFHCVMALADPHGRILLIAEGICRGTIAGEPRGVNGFGYDPVFIPDGYDKTFGELADPIKSKISHRRAAADEIFRYLRDNSIEST